MSPFAPAQDTFGTWNVQNAWTGITQATFLSTASYGNAWFGPVVAPAPILGRAATAKLNLLVAHGARVVPFRSRHLERHLSRRPVGVRRPHARTVRRRFRDIRR